MSMTSSAWRALALGAIPAVLLSCSAETTPGATRQASPATSTAAEQVDDTHPDKEVTHRARAALTEVGAQRLVVTPGYDHEINTAFTGVWRGHRLIAYVVPTSALPSASELEVVARRHAKGQAIDVVHGQHSTVRMLRFVLGPDTWLLTSRGRMPTRIALVQALVS